jgi:hypothetical protein
MLELDVLLLLLHSHLYKSLKKMGNKFEAQKTREDMHKNTRHTNMGRMWT